MQNAKVEQCLPGLAAMVGRLGKASTDGPGLAGLDLCCGDGDTTAHVFQCLRGLGTDSITGCDISQAMIQHAASLHSAPLRFEVADASKLEESFGPNEHDTFDFVFSFNGLHWMPHERHIHMLRGIRQVVGCDRGGQLPNVYLQFEAAGSLEGLLSAMRDTAHSDALGWSRRFPGSFDPGSDLTRPEAGAYQALMEEAGLVDVEVSSVAHVSKHRGRAGVLSRLRGAWALFPSVVAALPDNDDRMAFVEDVADMFESRARREEAGEGDGEEDTLLLLDNNLLVCQARSPSTAARNE